MQSTRHMGRISTQGLRSSELALLLSILISLILVLVLLLLVESGGPP